MSESGVPSLDLERFANTVAARLDDIVGALRRTSAAALSGPGDEFDSLRQATLELLREGSASSLIAGTGYASDPHPGGAGQMTWWARRGTEIVERLHSQDPRSDTFYDYPALRWFRLPKATLQPTLSGPVIDTWGSDDYTVTVSVPVHSTDQFYGVLAADIDVRTFVRTLYAHIREIPTAAALVNEDDRVIVSNTPTLSTGLPIAPRATRLASDTAVCRVPVAAYGWSAVALAP